MKLTSIKDKISNSIYYSIPSKCFEKKNTSFDIVMKIHGKIRVSNEESIESMQRRIINNLQNEINQHKKKII